MPCATQNEIAMKEAEQIVGNGIQYYIEVSNMPTTNEAMEYLQEHKLIIAPSKAVNAGDVYKRQVLPYSFTSLLSTVPPKVAAINCAP